MSHIGEQVSTAVIANLSDSLVVDQASICRGPRNDQLRAIELRVLFHPAVVNQTGLLI